MDLTLNGRDFWGEDVFLGPSAPPHVTFSVINNNIIIIIIIVIASQRPLCLRGDNQVVCNGLRGEQIINEPPGNHILCLTLAREVERLMTCKTYNIG